MAEVCSWVLISVCSRPRVGSKEAIRPCGAVKARLRPSLEYERAFTPDWMEREKDFCAVETATASLIWD